MLKRILGLVGWLGVALVFAAVAIRFLKPKYQQYYNGLAIGVVGVIFVLAFSGGNPLWFTIIGLVLTIPASLYGAHLAKKHRPASADQGR